MTNNWVSTFESLIHIQPFESDAIFRKHVCRPYHNRMIWFNRKLVFVRRISMGHCYFQFEWMWLWPRNALESSRYVFLDFSCFLLSEMSNTRMILPEHATKHMSYSIMNFMSRSIFLAISLRRRFRCTAECRYSNCTLYRPKCPSDVW